MKGQKECKNFTNYAISNYAAKNAFHVAFLFPKNKRSGKVGNKPFCQFATSQNSNIYVVLLSIFR